MMPAHGPHGQMSRTGERVIDGVTIRIGGRDWIVPPLTLGQMRRLLPQLQRLNQVGPDMGLDEIDVIVELVTAALGRNYPELTADTVAELLDLGNAAGVVHAILTGSGLVRTGEEMPAAMMDGALTDFTASSPPAADIRSPSSTQ
jgi:hypothetical protein